MGFPAAFQPFHLKDMLRQLNEASIKIDLRMNLSKTKIIRDTKDVLTMDGTTPENVDEYLNFGHIIKLGKENQTERNKT